MFLNSIFPSERIVISSLKCNVKNDDATEL